MSNSIQLTISAVADYSTYFNHKIQPGLVSITLAAAPMAGGVVSIGTSEEVVSQGDVSTAGYLYMRNLDETNYVEYGPELSSNSTMVSFGKLKPGEPCILRLKPGVVIRAKADTGACLLEYHLLSN